MCRTNTYTGARVLVGTTPKTRRKALRRLIEQAVLERVVRELGVVWQCHLAQDAASKSADCTSQEGPSLVLLMAA